MSERDQQLRLEANKEVKKNRDVVENDPYRLQYHITPPVGLLNDPNGLIQRNGIYHLFYQWMPFKTGHGAKFWGHYTSKDLVHWQEEPIALTPSDWFDKNGCYSGSAILHEDKLYLFYTGNVKDENGDRETYQCVAVSEDGVNFKKWGPVITLPDGYTPHFRDPKVWKEGNIWYMIIGAQTKNLEGKAILFQSFDLEKWEHIGPITESNVKLGYMWECPDFFQLNGEDVLLFSPQGLEAEGIHYHNVYQSGYILGKKNDQHRLDISKTFEELDRGFEFYAPQTFLDEQGRRILIGWMGVPEQDEDKQPTVKHKWVHGMTLPRELIIKGQKLYQTPVQELKKLREKQVINSNVTITDGEQQCFALEQKTAELLFEVNAADTKRLEISIRGEVRLVFHAAKKIFTLERRSFVDGLIEKRQCELESLQHLHIFLDHSSIEVFVNKGEEVFTSRMFPYEQNKEIKIGCIGKTDIYTSYWNLKRR